MDNLWQLRRHVSKATVLSLSLFSSGINMSRYKSYPRMNEIAAPRRRWYCAMTTPRHRPISNECTAQAHTTKGDATSDTRALYLQNTSNKNTESYLVEKLTASLQKRNHNLYYRLEEKPRLLLQKIACCFAPSMSDAANAFFFRAITCYHDKAN